MDQKEQLKEFGEKLRKIRESKDISLHRIFEITRNDLKYLQAIEQGNFDIMPEVYMKALLKEYAEAIELNPDEIVEEFTAIKEKKLEQQPDVETVDKSKQESPKKIFEETSFGLNAESDEGLKNEMIISGNKKIIFTLLGVVIVILAYFIFKPEPPKEIIKETPYKEVVKNQTEEKPSEIAEEKVSVKEDKKQSVTKVQAKTLGALTLVIEGTDTSWVRVTADGKLQGEFLIYPGVKKSFGADKYFTVLAGNSGGVNLYLNDNTLAFTGRKGRVRNLYIDKDGVKYLKIIKKKKDE